MMSTPLMHSQPTSTKSHYRLPSWATSWSAALLVSLVVFMLFVLSCYWSTGSIGASVAYLGGASVYSPPSITIDSNRANGQGISFTNLCDRPVKIVGYNPSCPCVVVSGLPVALPPWRTKVVPVAAYSESNKTVKVVFFFDSPTESSCFVNLVITTRTH